MSFISILLSFIFRYGSVVVQSFVNILLKFLSYAFICPGRRAFMKSLIREFSKNCISKCLIHQLILESEQEKLVTNYWRRQINPKENRKPPWRELKQQKKIL